MKKFLDEFKAFAMKGNFVDLAIGVVIGAAFGKIVSAMVEKVLMPIIGLVTGGTDFATLSFGYGKAQIGYGALIQAVIDFTIVAFFLFMVIKGLNALKAKEAAKVGPPPEPSGQEKLLIEIRDLLAKR